MAIAPVSIVESVPITNTKRRSPSKAVNRSTKSGSEVHITELTRSLVTTLSHQTKPKAGQKQTPEAIAEAISMSHALQSSDSDTIGPSRETRQSRPARGPLALRRSTIKPTTTRKAVCTHVSLERVWGPNFTCSHCRKLSPLGWSYQCAQDQGEDALPFFTLENLDVRNPQEVENYYRRLEDKSAQLGQISPWILKAITEGHYTEDQIVILETQKQGVNDMIFAAAEAACKEGDSTRYFPSRNSPPQRSSLSAMLNVKSPPTAPLSYGEYMLRLVPNRSQRCQYRTCQNCRPISRDRAWACIDHVIEMAIVPEINFEYDFRPISNVNLVRNIGLRTPPKPARPKLERPLPPLPPSSIDVTDARGNERGHGPDSSHHKLGIDGQSSESVTTQNQATDGSSIRKSLRRTLKGIWDGRRAWIPSRNPSQADQKISPPENRNRTKESETDSFKTQGTEDLDHLIQGTQVPLPGEDGKDALGDEVEQDKLNEDGEVIVSDGIAVTEEAILLHEANIITSV